MNAKHTPTPWHVVEINNGKDIQIDSEKLHICNITRYGMAVGIHEQENAKRIIHCVNMHDELVEALKYVQEMIKNNCFDDIGLEKIEKALSKEKGE